MDKLRVSWKIRARRYEEKVKKGGAGGITKLCWKEKEEYGWKDGLSFFCVPWPLQPHPLLLLLIIDHALRCGLD